MDVKKRIAYLISLVLLLIVVGFINHRLTRQRAQFSSNEYQEYEDEMVRKMNLAKANEDIQSTMKIKNDNNDSMQIIDSEESELEDISDKVNSQINKNISDKDNQKNTNYFVEFRLSRDKLRANLIEKLNEIINNDNTIEDIRSKAQEQILSIGKISQQELYIEGLIKAKGYEDALLFINDASVSVVVSIDELNKQDVAKILSIVKEETKLQAANIKIMKKQ
ncbi:SpoIIIAH-like family protein [Abyssisolibacter fermentans]|uniref:SpoIIIAH-like family protein n=1 Tax=Abyssisolibacter fermentans TaxID=1766203 RepID=UPI0008367C75|nr:SpoIIIAH-like family protein [Abyssisolibacter fermentans]